MAWTSQPPPPRACDVIGSVSLVTQNGVVVTAVKGNLVDHGVDVIVNTTSRDLALDNSGVSAAILKAAGQAIQQECNNVAPNGVKHGEVVVTGGHNLRSNKVYHGALPSWNTSVALKTLREFVTNCLETADNDNFRSIAFPAVGTGQLGYPRDQVTQAVYQEVADFSQNHPNSSVQEVRLVIFDKDTQTVQAFENHIQNLCSSGGGSSSSTGVGGYWKNPGPYTLETTEGITVSSIRGDITQQQVQVIVNSTTKGLDITNGSGVSAAIANAAGAQAVQQECKKACPNGVDYAEVCETSAGQLPCTYIYHGAVPQWSGPNAKHSLENFVENCLDKAHSDGIVSIAFPAIGTGEQKYPPGVVAQLMYDKIKQFSQNNRGTSVADVRLVLYDKDTKTIKAFGDEIQRLTGKAPAPRPVTKPLARRTPKPAARSRLAPSPSKKPCMVNVSVVQGDVTQETTDAIVNSTTTNMSLDAEVSQAILKAAGQSFHDEVKQLAQNGIGEVAETTGGNLQCSYVIHVVIPSTDPSGIIDTQRWNRMIEMCLNKAESLGLQSISFPALGTGKMGSDPTQMSQILLDSIYSYLRTCPVFTLRTIRIVIFNTQHLQLYQTAYQNAKSKRTAPSQSLPSNWTPMPPNQPVASVALSTSDSEYQTVANNFLKSLGSTRQIVQIERIQNPRTYLGYQNEKGHMDSVNGPGTKNERRLWHGTAKDAINDINSTNFNRSYCGKNATMYGKGVYFAMNASYSDQDQYSVPDANGHKYMYQALVLTGKSTRGDSTMKVPPTRDVGKNIKFDSAVDNVNNPQIFVVFYDSKAYPEYLITYKR